MAGKKNISKKRDAQRERLAPGSGVRVWPQAGEDGWCKTPRTMSIILRILGEKRLSGGADLASTYLDLWDRNMGEGLVELRSENEHASVSGFTSIRGPRTWRERVERLDTLGFVQLLPRGPVKFGYVLIIHPHLALRLLHEKGEVPDDLWTLLLERAESVGADMEVFKEPPTAEVVPLRSAAKADKD